MTTSEPAMTFMQYTIEYFKAKFQAIPEEKWCSDYYSNKGQCCVMGHLGVRHEDWSESDEATAFRELFSDQKLNEVSINDGRNPRFPQPTPKQRILAALDFIAGKQAQKEPEAK